MAFSSEGKSSDVAVQGFQLITLINQIDKNSEHTYTFTEVYMYKCKKNKKTTHKRAVKVSRQIHSWIFFLTLIT